MYIAAASAATIPGRATLFTFTSPAVISTATDALVDPGTTVTLRCQVVYSINSSSVIHAPSVQLKKTFGNGTWLIAENDVVKDQFTPLGRFAASAVDNQPNGIDVYEWTITSKKI